MLLPSIFGENLFDDWMDFSFPEIPDVDKTLYGKHAKNMMKTDVKETEKGYEVAVDLPGFKKEPYLLCRRECYRKRYPRKIRKWYFNTGCPEGRSKESTGKTIHIH